MIAHILVKPRLRYLPAFRQCPGTGELAAQLQPRPSRAALAVKVFIHRLMQPTGNQAHQAAALFQALRCAADVLLQL